MSPSFYINIWLPLILSCQRSLCITPWCKLQNNGLALYLVQKPIFWIGWNSLINIFHRKLKVNFFFENFRSQQPFSSQANFPELGVTLQDESFSTSQSQEPEATSAIPDPPPPLAEWDLERKRWICPIRKPDIEVPDLFMEKPVWKYLS